MDTPINDRDAYGQTALHYAVCHQDALPLVTILTESCAQLDADRQVLYFSFNIQLPIFAYKRLLNKPYENEITLR